MSTELREMPGVKRHHDGVGKETEPRASPFMPMFEVFRTELDEHHDRRERIIKASRDITAASKKIIFSLQRMRALKGSTPPKIASEIQERTAVIQQQFQSIAPDLAGINCWRYQRQISPGIQEYMEALSFEHYLRHQKLITIEEAAATMPTSIILTGDDYVLGLFDLVGELMRFSITTMATSGTLPGSETKESSTKQRDILMDLRSLRMSFLGLDTTSCKDTSLGRDAEKKMEVMNTCIEKVEIAVYGMIVRGRERPKGWVPDLSYDRGAIENY